MRLKNVMSRHVTCVGQLRSWGARQRDRYERNSPPRCSWTERASGALTEAIWSTNRQGVAKVEDAMVRHIAVATPETSISQAARMMRGRPEGALVVVEMGLVGMVSDLGSARCSWRAHQASP